MKRFLSLILIFSILTALIVVQPTTVLAATSGTCGNSLTWSFRNGILTISGTGYTYNFPSWSGANGKGTDAPWFSLRSSINSVVLENGVTGISGYAFAYCNNIKTISVPQSVSSIHYVAITNCPSLTAVNVDENNPYLCSDNGVLYNKSKTKILNYPAGRTDSSFKIPDTVQSIESGAFQKSINLTEVIMSPNIKTISVWAFNGCKKIKDITLPNKIETISGEAFSECTNLESVYIPKSLTSIGVQAFRGCSHIKNIYYGGNRTGWKNINIDVGNTSITNAALTYKANSILKHEKHDITIEVRDAKTNKLIPDSQISVFSDADNAKFYTLSNGKKTLKDISFPVYQIGVNAFGYDYHTSYQDVSYPENGKIVFELGAIVPPKKINVKGVDILGKREELILGEEYELYASVSPLNATNKKTSYNSSNTDVITVDDDGNIKAVGIGYSVVSVTTEDGGYSDSVQIRVSVPKTESHASFKDIAYKFDNASVSKKIALGVYKDVFGDDKGTIEYYNDETKGTNGVCAGIVATSMMFHNGYRNTNNYGATSIRKLSSWNKKLRNFIAYMYLCQHKGTYQKSISWNKTYKKDDGAIVNQIDIMVKTLATEILWIGIWGENGGHGHALLAYGMSYNHKDKNGNIYDKMWIYDCNLPNDDDRYVALYKNDNGEYSGEWRYTSKYNSQLKGASIGFVQYSAILSTAEERSSINLYSTNDTDNETSNITLIQNSDNFILENSAQQRTVMNNGICKKNEIDKIILSNDYYSENGKYRAVFPNDKYIIQGSNSENDVKTTVYTSSNGISWTNSNNAEITFDIRDTSTEGINADNYININNNSVASDYSITYMPFNSIYGYSYDTITVSGNTDSTINTYEKDGNIYVSGVDEFDVSVSAGGEIVTTTANNLNTDTEYCVKFEIIDKTATIQVISEEKEITDKISIPERKKVSQPLYDVASGTYSEKQTLTLTPDNEMTCLYYTTDGSEPHEDISMLYTEPISINESMTINVLAVQSGCESSDILTLEYTLPNIMIPVPTLLSGEYTGTHEVELIADSEADIYYTVDGTDPLENGKLYSYPIILTTDMTIKTYAEIDGCVSDVCEYEYTVSNVENCNINDIMIADEMVKVNITTNKKESGVLVVACYDEKQHLLDVNYCRVDLEANISNSKLIDINTCPASTVSAFLWDNFGTLTPLCNSLTKTITH